MTQPIEPVALVERILADFDKLQRHPTATNFYMFRSLLALLGGDLEAAKQEGRRGGLEEARSILLRSHSQPEADLRISDLIAQLKGTT